jgi:AcrR family transcriptional regulator
MDERASDTGWRGSPDGWLDAAYEALLESGVEAVKIQLLSRKLKLSRTSFYWFFDDREQLLSALLAKWRDKNTGNLVKRTETYAESIAEAILNVFDCWLDGSLFDSKFEFAIRSWAIQSSETLEAVNFADQKRIDALTRMFRKFGYDEDSADVRARTLYLTQIGYISMQTSEDIATRLRRIPEYVQIFTGSIPQQRELDRFFARYRDSDGSELKQPTSSG